MQLKWNLETRKLSELKEYGQNPRKITKLQVEHLKNSINTYGLIDRPCINVDGTLIGGHQRTAVLKKLGYKEIEVWVPNRELTADEVKKANVYLNKVGGKFDEEMLANNFDPNELIDLGWEADELLELLDDPEDKVEVAVKPEIKIGFREFEAMENCAAEIAEIVERYSGKMKVKRNG